MVVMLLLSECHLRIFRVRRLIPCICSAGHLTLTKCPWLLVIMIYVFLGGSSNLIIIVVLIASNNPRLSLAILSASSAHHSFLVFIFSVLPLTLSDLIEICAIILSLIVSILIAGVTGSPSSLALNDGGLF